MNFEAIINSIEQSIDLTPIESIFRFGNLSGKDIDLFLITTEDQLYKQLEVDIYDITIIGSKYVKRLIQFKDPIVIEPLVTGELIYGKVNYTQNLKNKTIVKTEEIVSHLKNCSIQILESAEYYLNNSSLKHGYTNLLFGLSYLCYADFYKNNKNIIVFSEIRNKYDFLNEVYLQKYNTLNLETLIQINNKIKTYIPVSTNLLI